MKKITLLTILCLLVFSFGVKAQQGQNCNDPIQANEGQNDVNHQNMYMYQWFEYTATQDAVIEIRCNLSSEDVSLNVYGDCMMMEYFGWDNSSGDMMISLDVAIPVGKTIYLEWYDMMLSAYQFDITENTNIPPGIACNFAIPANQGQNTVDHQGSEMSLWYSYVASQTSLVEIICTQEIEAELTLWGGMDCSQKMWIDWDDAMDNDTVMIKYVAAAGEMIYLEWKGDMMIMNPYEFEISENTSVPQGVACNVAHPASMGNNTVDHMGMPADQWFTYTATQDAIIEIRNTGVMDANLELLSGPNCVNKMWVDWDDGMNDTVSIDYVAFAGEILYLRWQGNASLTNPYDFTLNENSAVPPGVNCDDAMVATQGINTVDPVINTFDQWYSYTATADVNVEIKSVGPTTSNITVYSGPDCMSLMWEEGNGWMDTIIVVYHAAAGETFFIEWVSEPSLTSYDFTITEMPYIPSGEWCEEAMTAVQGVNTCGHMFGMRDQWFTYTVTQDAIVEIVQNGEEQANLSVFTGPDCMNLMWMAGDDGYGDMMTTVNYIATAGEVLYLNWMSNASLNVYTFTLNENTNIPVGINCEDAQVATLGSNTADHYNGMYEQWFTYTVSQNSIVTIENTGIIEANLELMSGTDCMNHMWIDSDDGWNDTAIYVSYIAQAGEELLLHWWNNSMLTSYTFNINEDTNIPAGAGCENAITANLGTNTSDHVNGVNQWFIYEVTEDALFTVSNCGDPSIENTWVEVLLGPFCTNPMWLNTNIMNCTNGKIEGSFKGFIGDQIFIKWLGAGNGYANGSYDWTLESTPLPPGTECFDPIDAVLGVNIADHDSGKFEQYYKYTASQDALVMISSCDDLSDNDTYVEVWGGDCMMMKDYQWNDNDCAMKSTVGYVAMEGEEITIRWANMYMPNTYEWTIEEDINIPPGIACMNALPATLGSSNTVDHSGGTFDQWFTYTVAQNAIVKITTCGFTTDNTSAELFVGSDCMSLMHRTGSWGSCDTLRYIASAGETLYIKWRKENLPAGVTPYNFLIEEDTNLPPGVSCGDPITASLGSNTVNHQGYDKWYEYTVAADGYLTIHTCGETEDTYVEVFRSCDDYNNYMFVAQDGWSCDQMQSKVILPVLSGETYLIMWRSWPMNPYDFTIEEATTLPEGMICANPITATSGTNTSDHTDNVKIKWYNYTATVNGQLTVKLNNGWHWLQAFKGGCPNDGGSHINVMNAEFTTWVTLGDEVYFAWENMDPTTFTYEISEVVSVLPPGLACDDPLTATEGLHQTNLNDGAKWYQYSPTSSGLIRVSSCGLTWAETFLNVFSDCSDTEVAFGERCGMQSEAEFNVQAGSDYYILWNTAWPEMIQWELNILTAVTIELSVATVDATCGQDNGSATVTATGGVEPYTYQWTNGSTDAAATDLAAGIYVVTVKDANGEESTLTVTINDDSGLSISEVVTNVTCKGAKNGAIDITVTGGTPPYTYLWSNGIKTADLTGIGAGLFEIVVTDNNGCVVLKSIQVTQPSGIYLSFSSVNSSCGTSDGSATASVAGGTSPYTYKWNNNATTSTISTLGAGSYTLTVTDFNSCTQSASVQINDKNAPTIQIDSINQSSCGSSDADVFVTVSGGAGSNTYSWSSGATTQDLINVGPGSYSLTVTDASSCKAIASAQILGSTPDTVEICMVTVDTATGMNQIVWEQVVSTDIDYYNIYKESSAAGVYDVIASVPYEELSTYVDTVSNPRIRSWRYKISAVDNCGNESELSKAHKTMHLTINYGFLGDINLIWDEYKGFDFASFAIMRSTVANGWEELTVLPSTLTSYTDIEVTDDTESYYVAVLKGSDCLATAGAKKANAGPFSRSLSNLEDNRLQSSGTSISENNIELSVYPNPTVGQVSIKSESNINTISIMDITGKVMSQINVNANNSNIDFTDYASGIYLLEISGQNINQIVKIVRK